MTKVKRLVVGLLVALFIVVGGAVAFAQGGDTPTPTTPNVEEVQFIGDPPGNNQTGEWEGEYEYEDEAQD